MDYEDDEAHCVRVTTMESHCSNKGLSVNAKNCIALRIFEVHSSIECIEDKTSLLGQPR